MNASLPVLSGPADHDSAIFDTVPVEYGDPVADPRAYRRCLSQFATGVTIITTEVDGVLGGVTANSYSSVSLAPPLVLWSISRQSRSFALFERARHFAINILAEDQIPVARHFSSAAEDKFTDTDWRANAHGVPLINGAVASLECHVEAVHEGGDHLIIIGKVERYARFNGRPLLFLQGAYGIAGEHPDAVVQAPQSAANGERQAPVLLHLLAQSWHRLSSDFAEHRESEGISVAQGQMIGALSADPGLSRTDLQFRAGLSSYDAQDALSDLRQRGFVNVVGESLRLTEQGEACRRTMATRWANFQAERLRGLSETEIAVLYRALGKVVGGPAGPV